MSGIDHPTTDKSELKECDMTTDTKQSSIKYLEIGNDEELLELFTKYRQLRDRGNELEAINVAAREEARKTIPRGVEESGMFFSARGVRPMTVYTHPGMDYPTLDPAESMMHSLGLLEEAAGKTFTPEMREELDRTDWETDRIGDQIMAYPCASLKSLAIKAEVMADHAGPPKKDTPRKDMDLHHRVVLTVAEDIARIAGDDS